MYRKIQKPESATVKIGDHRQLVKVYILCDHSKISILPEDYNNERQSQIQDFPKEGARFRVKCHVDAIQWGGGVVAELFVNSDSLCDSVGGGGGSNAEILSKGHFSLMGPFFLFLLSRRGGPGRRIFLFRYLKTSFSVNGALFSFFTFPKGGPGPPGPGPPGPPPLNRPLITVSYGPAKCQWNVLLYNNSV